MQIPLRNYAITTDKPWTVDQLLIIANSMGDKRVKNISEVGSSKTNPVYCRDNEDGVYNWSIQINGFKDRKQISYEDYLKLIKPGPYKVKRGSIISVNTTFTELIEVDIVSTNYVRTKSGERYFYNNLFSIVDDRPAVELNKITDVASTLPNNGELTKEQLKEIVKDMFNSPICSEVLNPNQTQSKGKTMKSMAEFFEMLKAGASNSDGKYLSLIIKNGEANVKSLIHQAYYAQIKDPRPYIKQLISRELNRLTSDLNTLNLENIDYGFNIKLASQVAYFKGFKAQAAKTNEDMDIEVAVNYYNFKKELATYTAARAATENNVCPFAWVKNHLTPANLNKPGKHTLFTSNKIVIWLKDGKLYFKNSDAIYAIPVKLTVSTNSYSF